MISEAAGERRRQESDRHGGGEGGEGESVSSSDGERRGGNEIFWYARTETRDAQVGGWSCGRGIEKRRRGRRDIGRQEERVYGYNK